jgi:hypothetical protein
LLKRRLVAVASEPNGVEQHPFTSSRSEEQLSRHEAAHAVAGFLFGHPLGEVTIETTMKLAGYARVGSRRNPNFDQALEDVIICLSGPIASGTVTFRTYCLPNVPDDDETLAIDYAMKVSKSMEETQAIVALGRARAEQLCKRTDFRELTLALAERLRAERELSGPDVEAFLAEQFKSFSAPDPGDAEGAVAASAAQEGTGDADLLEALPFDGAPAFRSRARRGSGGGRLA